MKRWIVVVALMVLSISLFTACSPDKSGGIKVAETYLNHLANGEYEAAYDLLSDYDKTNIDKDTYLKWKQQVAQIIKIKSATVDPQADRFNNYKYQGTTIGYALGLKISRVQDVLIPNIELDGYNKDFYRQMVVYENNQWKMLLLLTKLDETVAAYQAQLDKQSAK
jgi:hypothetical protein